MRRSAAAHEKLVIEGARDRSGGRLARSLRDLLCVCCILVAAIAGVAGGWRVTALHGQSAQQMLGASHLSLPVEADVVGDVPVVAKDALRLYVAPERFVIEQRRSPNAHASVPAATGWTLAFVALLVRVYRLIGPRWSARFPGVPPLVTASPPESTGRRPFAKPRIAEITFWERRELVRVDLETGDAVGRGSERSIGLSVNFPEARSRGLGQPQLAIFGVGAVIVYVENVIPGRLNTKFLQTLVIGFLAVLTTLCVYPFAILLGGHASVKSAFAFAMLYWAYTVLFFAGLMIVSVPVVLAGVLTTRSGVLILVSSVVELAGLALTIRAFFGVFMQVYDLSAGRLLLSGLGGTFAGCVLSVLTVPILFVPVLYLVLRFHNWWDAAFDVYGLRR